MCVCVVDLGGWVCRALLCIVVNPSLPGRSEDEPRSMGEWQLYKLCYTACFYAVSPQLHTKTWHLASVWVQEPFWLVWVLQWNYMHIYSGGPCVYESKIRFGKIPILAVASYCQNNRKVTAEPAYQSNWAPCSLAACWAQELLVVLLVLWGKMGWLEERKRVRNGGETWGRWMRACREEEGGFLLSCRLDILCFDGLAFIFTAVFPCHGGAVLKSSIFSWYYRTHSRLR